MLLEVVDLAEAVLVVPGEFGGVLGALEFLEFDLGGGRGTLCLRMNSLSFSISTREMCSSESRSVSSLIWTS